MSWNLHIVGEKVLAEVDDIAAEIVKALEDRGHQLVSAILTDDLSQRDVAVTPAPEPEPEPVPEPVPATEPAPVPDVDNTPAPAVDPTPPPAV
jgi:outer membrane biosynthesis protein TonB